MSFAAQLATPASLTLDWYQRHPALGRVTLHVEGLNAEDIQDTELPDQVRDALLALDVALANHVASQAGLPCTPAQPAPVALLVE